MQNLTREKVVHLKIHNKWYDNELANMNKFKFELFKLAQISGNWDEYRQSLEKVKYISSGSRIFTLACLGPRSFGVSERVLYQLPEFAELMAQHKVVRDSKVLIKKTHKIVCRISGETENDTHTELSIVMPLTSLDSVYDIEKKLDSDDYQESMKSYIFMLKGASSHIIGVMTKLFSDNVLFNFNWDGVQGK
ncbi:uncharacterized protein [Eurosta solidaginis]|uniref:uncharacterized protein n=1 Tax=Eurosta solidaginis TaxID=178769 RepID=UPI0035312EAA